MDNHQFDKFRLPLAILLSAGVFFIYYQYVTLTTPPPEGPAPKPLPEQNPAVESPKPPAPPLTPPEAIASLPTPPQPTQMEEERFITLENEHIKITLSTYNAAVVKSVLKNQNTVSTLYDLEEGSLAKLHTATLSFTPNFTDAPPVVDFSLVEPSPRRLPSVVEEHSGAGGEPKAPAATFVNETLIGGQKVTVHKHYVLNGYQLKLIVSLISQAPTPLNTHYYLYNGSSLGEIKKEQGGINSFDITSLSYTLGEDNENALKPHFYSSEKDFAYSQTWVDWIAIDNRFYLRTLIPSRKEFRAEFSKKVSPKGINYISAIKVPVALGPIPIQDTFTYSFLPKNRTILNQLSDGQAGIAYYLIFRQYSWMKILSDFLHGLIVKINQWVGNYGWAIVIMTLILKIVTYPLTQKSYVSMQKMQALNPKVEEIRKKYKNNAQKAQVEIMGLYRKEKINPAMGCFPMLIPIPIFFALYVLFQNMTELNNAPFLWIENLAYPDQLATLPFALPLVGAHFNLLPLLMAVSQYFQSALTPQTSNNEMAQTQAKMMKYFLPIFFLFICWNLPSALVLFWFVQNIFAIFQTLLTKKKEYKRKNIKIKELVS